jgi:hypothetical protein
MRRVTDNRFVEYRNFAIGYCTPYLVDVGPGKAGLQSNVFFIWGSCCALCFLFTFFWFVSSLDPDHPCLTTYLIRFLFPCP